MCLTPSPGGPCGMPRGMSTSSARSDWELAKQAVIHTGDGSSYTTSASTHLYWRRGMVCVEQHLRQGDPATSGRLTERHLFLQRCWQQEVLLNVHEQDLLLVSAAGLITVIIGLAAS
jgi:hypothetical protein